MSRSILPSVQALPYQHSSRDVPSRLDVLEERLAQQERTSHSLLSKAFKIKEDVVNSLGISQGTREDEQRARIMLQEHIKTITAVVNHLNHDITTLEKQIRLRDSAAINTNQALKTLEVHHATTLTDIRGRVVRCDSSISKLCSDLRNCSDSIKAQNHHLQSMQNKVQDRFHSTEAKIIALSNEVDKVTSECMMKLQSLHGDSSHQLSALDVKTRSLVEELKNALNSGILQNESNMKNVEMKLTSLLEKGDSLHRIKQEKLDKKIDESLYTFESHLNKLERIIMAEQETMSQFKTHIENIVVPKLESALQQQSSEISKWKKECRQGFTAVHESLSNMKTVMEGKRKLSEEQLKKEIRQIRKMVVLV